jgi:hypothetical protein
MRILFICVLLLVALTQRAQAQPTWAPPTVVAQTAWPNREAVTLLVDMCDTRTGTMRAQWVTRDRTVIWGCWGYNPTGVQVQWQSGKTEFIDWLDLWAWSSGVPQQMGYQTIHQRIALLRTIK